MKRSISFFVLLLFIATACENKKSADTTVTLKDDDKGKVTIDLKDAEKKALDMQKKKEELESLTPLTKDELSALVPGKLMGVPHAGIDINEGMGTMVADADYKINDSADIHLEIVDCGGPGGSGMFSVQYMNMLNVSEDSEDEYLKSIDFAGGRAIENCKKKRNRCTLAYFNGNRFLVSLRGDNVSMDELKDIAMGLNFK